MNDTVSFLMLIVLPAACFVLLRSRLDGISLKYGFFVLMGLAISLLFLYLNHMLMALGTLMLTLVQIYINFLNRAVIYHTQNSSIQIFYKTFNFIALLVIVLLMLHVVSDWEISLKLNENLFSVENVDKSTFVQTVDHFWIHYAALLVTLLIGFLGIRKSGEL